MPGKQSKAAAAVKPLARRTRAGSKIKALRNRQRTRAMRKTVEDRSLFGAIPNMGKWALPLLKELRDE